MMKNKIKPKVILVIGGPASGKGTYCKKICDEFGFVHLSIGDILREARLEESEEGRFLDYQMQEFEKNGKLMPSEIVAQFLFKKLFPVADKNKNSEPIEQPIYLVDGFIKAKAGLDCWNKMFSKLVELKFILFLECSKEGMLKRLTKRSETSTRLDDNVNIFQIRVDTFFQRTYPTILLLDDIGVVVKVNTERNIDEVYEEIQKSILTFVYN
jgi:UMP-CMP kinase